MIPYDEAVAIPFAIRIAGADDFPFLLAINANGVWYAKVRYDGRRASELLK